MEKDPLFRLIKLTKPINGSKAKSNSTNPPSKACFPSLTEHFEDYTIFTSQSLVPSQSFHSMLTTP